MSSFQVVFRGGGLKIKTEIENSLNNFFSGGLRRGAIPREADSADVFNIAHVENIRIVSCNVSNCSLLYLQCLFPYVVLRKFVQCQVSELLFVVHDKH